MSDEEPQSLEQKDFKEDLNDANKLPKHMRARYWTSYEEMRLMELWRRHYDNVTTLQKNMPIFKEIAAGMKEHGFFVNGQECRRKISSLKNKYLAEQRRQEDNTEQTTSQWRLYPLIQHVLMPKKLNTDCIHEINVLNSLLNELPQQAFTATPQQLIHPILMNPMDVAPKINPLQQTLCNPIKVTGYNDHTSAIPQINKRAYIRRQPLMNATPPYSLLRQRFTHTSLAQLRAENACLTEQRDMAQTRLRLEEQEYKFLEEIFQQCQQKQQIMLQSLQTLQSVAQ